jgi:hypothetical protein
MESTDDDSSSELDDIQTEVVGVKEELAGVRAEIKTAADLDRARLYKKEERLEIRLNQLGDKELVFLKREDAASGEYWRAISCHTLHHRLIRIP